MTERISNLEINQENKTCIREERWIVYLAHQCLFHIVKLNTLLLELFV